MFLEKNSIYSRGGILVSIFFLGRTIASSCPSLLADAYGFDGMYTITVARAVF